MKLKSRHPAVYTHKKYSNITKLLLMDVKYKKVIIDNDTTLYIWKTSAGSVKLGAVDWLVELLQKYPKPSVDFLNEYLAKIRSWERPNSDEYNIEPDGQVIFDETREFNTLLIDAKFSRFIAKKQYEHNMKMFAQAYKDGKSPDYKEFHISYKDAKAIKNKLKSSN